MGDFIATHSHRQQNDNHREHRRNQRSGLHNYHHHYHRPTITTTTPLTSVITTYAQQTRNTSVSATSSGTVTGTAASPFLSVTACKMPNSYQIPTNVNAIGGHKRRKHERQQQQQQQQQNTNKACNRIFSTWSWGIFHHWTSSKSSIFSLLTILLLTVFIETTTTAKIVRTTTALPSSLVLLNAAHDTTFDVTDYSQQQQQQQHQPHQQQQQQQQQQQHTSHNHRQRDVVQLPGVPSSTSSTIKSSISPPTTTVCEPRVLDELPPDPFYDVTDIAEDAAKQFAEFLSLKSAPTTDQQQQQFSDEIRRYASNLATVALQEDENLLAFAIAAPSIQTAVVKFRDNVTIPAQEAHNKSFLASYWRELGLAWNGTDGSTFWGAPFRDCNALKGRWLWPFRLSVVDFGSKIVAAAFIAADIDLCNDALEEIFGRRHGCDRETTFCLLTETKPSATRDGYNCICRESFYLPNSTLQSFSAEKVENSDGFENFSCILCPGGCLTCDQNGVCLFDSLEETVSMENLLRAIVGAVLGACILCCIVLSVLIFRQRKCKAIASGMWTVLETILLGIVLLYASVAVHFFQASTLRCLIEPWFRELGFITCYGAIILKLYRHLVEFRTRKAHRWVLRDVDLLKYLSTMVFAVICYMSAFSASSLDLIESAKMKGLQEVDTNTCHPMRWDLVTQFSELFILCFGLNLAVACRNANTQFRERQFLVAALLIEMFVSTNYITLRIIYLHQLSPGAILLVLFLRSQLTNTVTLGLIFLPKLWYQHKQGSHDTGHHLGGGYAGLCLGDPDIGELTISEMSPEDIRAELKRLYTQLEVMKNKTLRQDNPHISKRRGGRKAGHRRFSLQALSAKHRSNKHHQDVEITEAEPSRTPEDSVCSAEGPTDTFAEVSGISHSMLSHSMVSHTAQPHAK